MVIPTFLSNMSDWNPAEIIDQNQQKCQFHYIRFLLLTKYGPAKS